MLAIKSDKTAPERRCTPNILPCRINHNGPVAASERYWDPSAGDDGTRTAYFRGHKLLGKAVKVPEGYRGVVVSSTDKILPQNSGRKSMPGDDPSADFDDEQPEEVKIMEEHASFDEIVVWGHEALPDAAADPYVKSMEEWVEFAEQIHSFPPSANGGQEAGGRR